STFRSANITNPQHPVERVLGGGCLFVGVARCANCSSVKLALPFPKNQNPHFSHALRGEIHALSPTTGLTLPLRNIWKIIFRNVALPSRKKESLVTFSSFRHCLLYCASPVFSGFCILTIPENERPTLPFQSTLRCVRCSQIAHNSHCHIVLPDSPPPVTSPEHCPMQHATCCVRTQVKSLNMQQLLGKRAKRKDPLNVAKSGLLTKQTKGKTSAPFEYSHCLCLSLEWLCGSAVCCVLLLLNGTSDRETTAKSFIIIPSADGGSMGALCDSLLCLCQSLGSWERCRAARALSHFYSQLTGWRKDGISATTDGYCPFTGSVCVHWTKGMRHTGPCN
ncbi:Hypothetical predicted protein, partial [Drosophila guanche]